MVDGLNTSPATHTPSDFFIPENADWTGEAWFDEDPVDEGSLDEAATRIQAARRAKAAREEVKQIKSGGRMLPSQSLSLELIQRAIDLEKSRRPPTRTSAHLNNLRRVRCAQPVPATWRRRQTGWASRTRCWTRAACASPARCRASAC